MIQDDLAAITKQLYHERKARGLSQVAVGILMDRDQSYVSEIERTQYLPRILSVQRLAEALGFELTVTMKRKDSDG